jgi:hypothetical protein
MHPGVVLLPVCLLLFPRGQSIQAGVRAAETFRLNCDPPLVRTTTAASAQQDQEQNNRTSDRSHALRW